MKKVKVLRGIPGSGKSTLAKQLFAEEALRGCVTTTCSADDHFMRDGVYIFNYKKLGDAHNECFRKFVLAVLTPKLYQVNLSVDGPREIDELIVVDNTHTTYREILPYARVCEAFGVPFEIITIDCDPAIAHARGLHGVPLDRVWAMQKRLLDAQLPKEWPHRVVKATVRLIDERPPSQEK